MEKTTFIAKLNNIRISPQKAVLVANLIKGMPVEKAIANIQFTEKKTAYYVHKLLLSSVANANNNFGVKAKDLVVSSVIVNQAVTFKRGRPVSRGRFFKIMKRGSNLIIELKKI